jgi:nucleoredoxin
VFVSSDNEESEYKEYFASMPWVALPLGHSAKDTLSKKFRINGIPALILLDGNGAVINTEGRTAVGMDVEGKKFPWKPPTFFDSLGSTFTNNGAPNVSFDSLKGKTLGLYFSASWCGPCRFKHLSTFLIPPLFVPPTLLFALATSLSISRHN